jgi:hypothetical protein
MESPQANGGLGVLGQQGPSDAGSSFNATSFIIRQLLGRINTVKLVEVQAVTNNGGVSPIGTVDVLPLVDQIDGAGNTVPYPTLFGMKYFRLAGGSNAIIIDPQVGDIGLAVFADRDSSSAIATGAQSPPGSRRQFDLADGFFIGFFLGGAPTQYIEFSAAGITIVSPTKITLQAPVIEKDASTEVIHNSPLTQINGNVGTAAGTGGSTGTATFSGAITSAGNVTAGQGGADQVSLQTHKHGTGTAASGTIAPTPGT